jgi:putative MATE family efflux protein
MRARGIKLSETMGKDSVNKLLIRFSTPSVISMVVSASYSLVDSIFVGRLGPEGLAALAVASPLMMIYNAIGQGTGVGAASLVGRCLGAKNYVEANRAACLGITAFFIVGGLVTVIALLFLEPLLRLFGADNTVLPLARTYMFIETSFIVVDFLHLTLAELIRAEGHPVIASSAMITSGITNCIFDPILMFGLGPIRPLGIAGAALATTVGRSLGIIMLLTHLLSSRTSYHFHPSYFIPDFKVFWDIYRVGLASILRRMAGSLSHIVANRMAAPFGMVPLAVLGVIFRTSSLANQPCMGLGQGMLPLVAYNSGARQFKRIGEVVLKTVTIAFVWTAFCWVIAMTLARNVMSIFSSDPAFLAEGSRAFRIFSLAFFTVGTQHILGYFFQGIGRGFPALILGASRQLLFMIPLLLILPRYFGLPGLWAAFPIADALALIIAVVWTRVAFHELGIPFSLRRQDAS